MSSIFSDKYLKQRGLASVRRDTVPITDDVACANCGYNLRGLHYGRNCPECGHVIKRSPGLAKDVLMGGELSQRELVRLGLGLILLVTIACIPSRVLATLGVTLPVSDSLGSAYLWQRLGLGVFWVVGVWLVTPPRFGRDNKSLRIPGFCARLGSLGWVAMYGAAIIHNEPGLPSGTEKLLLGTIGLGLSAAAAGTIMFGLFLTRLAVAAELDDATRRIWLCTWLVPAAWLFLFGVPLGIPWGMLMFAGIPLGLWAWTMWWFSRGVLELFLHVHWSIRHVHEGAGRDTRVRQTRESLREQVSATVRPVHPAPAEDVPLTKRPG